jgi:hypothetical protein
MAGRIGIVASNIWFDTRKAFIQGEMQRVSGP